MSSAIYIFLTKSCSVQDPAILKLFSGKILCAAFIPPSSVQSDAQEQKHLRSAQPLPSQATPATPLQLSPSTAALQLQLKVFQKPLLLSMTAIMEQVEESFNLFPNLPIELRLKVWEAYHRFTPPQFISLFLVNNSDYDFAHEHDCERYPHIFLLPHPFPRILHISHEARQFGLQVYHAGFEVSQRLDTRGSWWKPEVIKDGNGLEVYKPCLHEIGVNMDDTKSFCYWDPTKDVIALKHSELSLSEITKQAAWIWSGRCNIYFSNIRWLSFSDVVAKTWLAGPGTVSSSTIWRGMEAMFMIVPEIKRGRTGWVFKERIKKDKTEAYESGNNDVWVGRGKSLAPQICLVPAKRRSEMKRLITKRIDAGEESCETHFSSMYVSSF